MAGAGLPEGVLNVISGFGETAGAALAAHDGVDKIAFTGSTEVGKLIAAAAAGNLKKVSLELGGKSPSILESGRADGATAVTGGGRFGDRGHFVEPTVLTNTTPDMKIVREEIFGPVVVAATFSDLDEIAAAANDTDSASAPGSGPRTSPRPTPWPGRSGPARCGSTATACLTRPCRSADTSSPAGSRNGPRGAGCLHGGQGRHHPAIRARHRDPGTPPPGPGDVLAPGLPQGRGPGHRRSRYHYVPEGTGRMD